MEDLAKLEEKWREFENNHNEDGESRAKINEKNSKKKCKIGQNDKKIYKGPGPGLGVLLPRQGLGLGRG